MSLKAIRSEIKIPCSQGSIACSIVEVEGSSHDAVVLLHGFLSNRREIPVATENAGMFEVLAEKFAECEISTVRIDFRGCGESSGLPLGACTPTSMVQDVLSLGASTELAAVLGRGFVLVGWCQGAVAATHATLLGLQGCSRIVLLNPFVDYRTTLTHVYGKSACDKALASKPDAFLEIQVASGKTRRVLAGFFHEMFAIDEAHAISRVPIPVHIIKATRDMVLPKQDFFNSIVLELGSTCDLIETDHAFGSFTDTHDLDTVTNLVKKFVRRGVSPKT
ncbi:alpha/beta fold hydrolase [Ruegeria sp. EL01]|uniref:alpha/beta fold hydrolase n=1 Tax=Ruegeria sp. EL01 TaxID=2107578 RepID=UPI000EA83193|nr:alpha/beta hydrolase [Ruegeria sp. EL01]